MCRFTLYLGPPIRLSSFLFESEHSLVAQSSKSRERADPLNGDGFGVGWYASELSAEPAVFRSITPAWNNRNLQGLSRVVTSGCVLGHVRAATHAGGVNEANCHPFRYRELLFMHNGDVARFPKLRRALLDSVGDAAFENVFGSTDSEHVFALMIDELEHSAESTGAERLATALERALWRVIALSERHAGDEACYLNMALSDGEHAVAVRFSTDLEHGPESLYYHYGRSHLPLHGRPQGEAAEDQALFVSSERLSSDASWFEIPANHLVLSSRGAPPEVRACRRPRAVKRGAA